MKELEITTIVPTYQRPELLRRAVTSIQNQTYRNLKICIYDNASGDSTENVVRNLMKHDNRISYMKRESNIGGINNMEDGCSRVTTPLYSFLNDDDMLLPGMYASAVEAFKKFPDAGFISAKTMIFQPEQMNWRLLNQDWDPGKYEATIENAAKMHKSHFPQTGVVLRREFRDTFGSFERSGDDQLQMSIAAATFPFVVLDCVGAVFTQHSQSFSAMGGLRGGGQDEVFQAFNSTMQRISALQLPEKTKAYLLLLTATVYGDSFTWRSSAMMLGRRVKESGNIEKLLPEVRCGLRATSQMLKKIPNPLQPFAKSLINGVIDTHNKFTRFKNRKNSGWNQLSEEMSTRLNTTEAEQTSYEIAEMLEQKGYKLH